MDELGWEVAERKTERRREEDWEDVEDWGDWEERETGKTGGGTKKKLGKRQKEETGKTETGETEISGGARSPSGPF
jgi:hypothetical protein